jgi:hypothetical protein
MKAPQGYRISLMFVSIKLSKISNVCRSDYVIVIDGASSSDRVIARLCYSGFVNYFSSGEDMIVRFVSGNESTNQGFKAKYIAIPIETKPSLSRHMTSSTIEHTILLSTTTSKTQDSVQASSTTRLDGLPSQTHSKYLPMTPSSTPSQTLAVSPSKATSVVPSQTPTPGNQTSISRPFDSSLQATTYSNSSHLFLGQNIVFETFPYDDHISENQYANVNIDIVSNINELITKIPVFNKTLTQMCTRTRQRK